MSRAERARWNQSEELMQSQEGGGGNEEQGSWGGAEDGTGLWKEGKQEEWSGTETALGHGGRQQGYRRATEEEDEEEEWAKLVKSQNRAASRLTLPPTQPCTCLTNEALVGSFLMVSLWSTASVRPTFLRVVVRMRPLH